MVNLLSPINVESLSDVFVSRFEQLILSGQISIGQRLPSERELAHKMGVSRPVVHEGLLTLQTRGLITLKPRVGAYVNDYRRQGSITMLESLLLYRTGELDAGLFESLLQMRELFELETARLAALNRSDHHISAYREIIENEKAIAHSDLSGIVELDFAFHHLTALASGNMVYPLIVNSFKPVYTNLTGQFFENPRVVDAVFKNHARFFHAVQSRDPGEASNVMKELLSHGAHYLRKTTAKSSAESASHVV